MEIDETDGNDGQIYRLKKWWNTENINRRERDKRNELSTKYNNEVNIIGVIDNCLGLTVIWLGITGVGLLSTIVDAPAVIGMEAVTIVLGLLRVVGNRAIQKKSLKIENMKRLRCYLFQYLTLSVVSFEKHYQLTPFQMKNVH